MPTVHIESKKGEISDIVLMPGDPKRSEYIAKKFLSDCKLVNSVRGMFAYTGLSKNQVKLLKERYHIYMTNSGRISLSGLNAKNVNYVAKCFHEVSKL